MSTPLHPGETTLATWRAIYRGAPLRLSPNAAPCIARGAEAVARILERGEPVYGINTGFGKLASVRIEPCDLAQLQRNIVLSHAAGVGEPMPVPIARLMMALKLASLAQAASGVAPATVALDRNGLAPLALGPKEGLALLNGTQFSTANALAGLFETERLYQSALVTGALATEAAKGSDTPFDHRIHILRRHAGQIETADALRALMAGSRIRASHLKDDERVQDPYCLRCQPQVMGATLSILRQAARTLEDEANGVTDNPLIFAGDQGDPNAIPEALSGGNFHAEPRSARSAPWRSGASPCWWTPPCRACPPF